jgi:hypothetical protein
MGVVLLLVELNRKNKEDVEKKEKERSEKAAIRDLHERHLRAEKVSLHLKPLAAAAKLRRRALGMHAAAASATEPVAHPPSARAGRRHEHGRTWLALPVPVATCPLGPTAQQDLREELRTVSRQLHSLDEKLQFMEQQLGRRRSWLPLWGS